MFKVLLGLILFLSTLCSDDISDYKEALNNKDFEKVFGIYQKYIQTKQLETFKSIYFNTIIDTINSDSKNAQKLIDELLQFAYDDPYLHYLQSQLYYENKDFEKSIEILYKLENSYLDGDLRIKVKKNLDIFINNYLVYLYEQNNLEKLKNAIIIFNKYDDKKGRDLWIGMILQCANDFINQKEYDEAITLVQVVKPYYLNMKNKKNYKIIVNNIGVSYLDSIEKTKDMKSLENLITFLEDEDSNNLYFAKKLYHTIKEEQSLANIKGLKVPLEFKNNQYYIDGYIDGKRAKFLIDTGATTTMINRSFAATIRYDLVDKNMKIQTALGSGKADFISVDRFSVSFVNLDYFELIVSKKDVFNGYDGLLGMNFLNKFDFKIDRKNNLLILNVE